MELIPSYGGASFAKNSRKVIRLIMKGCVNRPFYHISVQEKDKETDEPVIEQLGSYDPMPNQYNEKLVGINFERLEYWLRQGADTTEPVRKLLGLSGYFPVHPKSYEDAFYRRKSLLEDINNLKIKAAELGISKEKIDSPLDELSEAAFTEAQSSNTSIEEQSDEVQSSNTSKEEQSDEVQSSNTSEEEHSDEVQSSNTSKEEHSDDKGDSKS